MANKEQSHVWYFVTNRKLGTCNDAQVLNLSGQSGLMCPFPWSYALISNHFFSRIYLKQGEAEGE